MKHFILETHEYVLHITYNYTVTCLGTQGLRSKAKIYNEAKLPMTILRKCSKLYVMSQNDRLINLMTLT